MKKPLKHKKILITGCSSGFGLLTTVAAANAGFDVIATMRNLEKAQYLRQALENANVKAQIEQLDVCDSEQIKDVARKIGPVDILVNNAGILVMGSALDITEHEMRRVFETNYFGAVELTRAVVPGMINSGGGMIINVASLAGRIGHMFNATYSASKHALVGFSRSIRTELKPFNIKVVSVEPGYHKTEIIRANANVSENFYDKSSPMFEYNRGFLRLMMKKVIPRAAEAETVANKIVDIILTENPKPHYIIGKDARMATIAQRLGLMGVFEKFAYKKLLTARDRENTRAEEKKRKRKEKKKN